MIGTYGWGKGLDVICLLLVIFITIILQINIVGDYASMELRKLFVTKSGNFHTRKILTVIGILAAIIILFRFILHRYKHIVVIDKIRSIIRGIWEGLTSVKLVKRKTAFFLHSIFIWAMYLMSIRIGFYAMDAVNSLASVSFTILRLEARRL
jgi:hypothetical protein